MREVRNPSLSAITTLGLGGTCSLELTVSSRDDLAAMDDRIRELGLPVYVVGAATSSDWTVPMRPFLSGPPSRMGRQFSGMKRLTAGFWFPAEREFPFPFFLLSSGRKAFPVWRALPAFPARWEARLP